MVELYAWDMLIFKKLSSSKSQSSCFGPYEQRQTEDSKSIGAPLKTRCTVVETMSGNCIVYIFLLNTHTTGVQRKNVNLFDEGRSADRWSGHHFAYVRFRVRNLSLYMLYAFFLIVS